MTLEEIEKRLNKVNNQLAQKSPNYENSVAYKLNSVGQNVGQYIAPTNRVITDNRVGANLQRNNINPQAVMKAPVSSTINKTLQTIPTSSKKKYTVGENASSILYGAMHLGKPIVKAKLNLLNDAIPYYYNIKNDIKNITSSVKNKDISNASLSMLDTVNDVLSTPADYIIDKGKNVVAKQLEKNGKNADKIRNFDPIGEDKYNDKKLYSRDEIQQIVNDEYDKHTPNKKLAEGSKTASDIAVSTALQFLGVPQAVTYGVLSGAETYGNTDSIKEIAGDTVIGAGTGLISDFATPAIKETAKAIIPNVGKKIAPTLVANYGSNFLGGYMSSYGANTIGQQIKNGSLNITPEQEKEINSNALSFAIFSSLLGGTKDTVLDIKNAKIQLNQDVNNTIEKLKDANAQLERTDYTTNEAIQARLKARGNSIIEDLESNNYLLNNKNKDLAVKMLRTAYDSGNINNINYANNQVIALLGSAEMNSKISQQLSQITNQETANKITVANEKLMQSNIPEETKWNILDEATALYDQTKDVDKMVELIDNRLNNVAIPIQEQVTNQTQAIAPITSESNNTIEGKKGSFFDYSKEKIDNSIVKNAEDIVSTNRNGKRTKEQTLQLAEQIGFNAPADKIDIYAHKTWQELRPYEKLTKGFVSYNQWETRMKEANAKAQSANIATNASSTMQDAEVQVGKNSLKEQQLEIIKSTNPMTDDYHTGIRNVEDIKTFSEAIEDEESFVYGDFSKEDAMKALQNGKVTVYSSQPIENGIFVSTSKNMAKDYAGNGKIYSKEVPVESVAWINGDEGQYAEVINNKTLSNNDSLSTRLTGDELLNAQDLIEELKSVGADIDNNGYVTLYHATNSENAKNIIKTGKMKAKEDGLFFSTKKDGMISGFGDSIVELKVPVEKVKLDDLFDNEAHVKIPLNSKDDVTDINEYLVKNRKENNKFNDDNEIINRKMRLNVPVNNKFDITDVSKYINDNRIDIKTEKVYNKITTKNISNRDIAQASSEIRKNGKEGTHLIKLSRNGYKAFLYEKNDNEIQIKAKIEGTEDFIEYIERSIEDGTYKRATTLTEWSTITKSEFRRYSGNNDILSRRRKNNGNDKLSNRKYRQGNNNNGRNDIKENSEYESRELEKSSSLSLSINKEKINVPIDETKVKLTDNSGRTLTTKEKDFIKEGTLKDDEGNVKKLYSGSPNGNITEFKAGSYFTENKEYADLYQNPNASMLQKDKNVSNPKTYEVYLKTKKPFDTKNDAEAKRIFEEEFYGKYGNGSALMESGYPDWVEELDLREFMEEKGYDYDLLILDEGATGGYGEKVKERGLSYVTMKDNQAIIINDGDNSSNNVDNNTPKINPPIAEDLKKSMIDNSSKEAQEVLNSDKIEVKQGRTNSKVVSNDDNIQVSRSGNIYPEGNKITSKEYVTTGADEHYKKGDTRFIPIDSKHADKGYVTQKWNGEKWIDADDYNDFDKLLEDNGINSTPPTNNDSNNDSPFDENGKSKTLDFISESRKKDKVKLTELGDFMMQKWVNKGHYVDKLAEKTNNPNLKYAYDKTLSTYGEANYSIGVAQTDNNGKEIGKSIIDIFKPSRKANLYNEFNDYLINRHRLDRQALGKAVYNESVTSEDSRKIIETYEKNHPEFKEWAEDVYKFNRNELHNLVEEGFISKETEEYLHEIYGDYVPLHRDIIEVATQAEDARKTGAINPIKKSTGGSQNILNIEDAMAENVVNNKKAIRRNQLGKELAKSTGNEKIIGDYGVDTSIFSPEAIINVSNNAGVERINGEYLYNIFVDGEMKQFKVDENLFESLRADTADIRLKNKSKALTKYILDPTEKVTKLQRDVLTTYSIGFSLNNPIKDFQDGLFYSKFGPKKFIEGYGKALYQIATKGKYSKEYDALGGLSNSYFEYGKGVKKDSKNPVSKVLEKVRDINEIIEKAPRLSEYINSIEAGMSKSEAMYNASDITTNFKRGGEYAKVINKYGANFFNASIQGLDKTIRTFTGKKAGKAWLRLLVNVASLGIVPTLINSLLYKDDEDYQNLESYIKDEYYLIKMENLPIPNNKNYDGIFIRIPKGRVLSVIGATTRRILEGTTGGDFDLKGLGQEITNQIAPNNPVKDNVFAPIMQVATNKTWYGSAMVPKRLQNQLPKNQYKEDTDYVSMWLGEQLNISPIKINYLIDQYSGGFGDVFLPMITPKAENNILTDKFTTDSVLKNKNVGEFYDNVDKYEKLNNDVNPTQENTTKYSYLKKVSTKVGELYSQKRNIQMDSTLSDKEKQTLTREIQKEINMYCETANNLVNDKFTDDNKWNMYVDGILSDTVRDSDGSSQLQDALYAVNNGLATKKEYMDVYEKYKANGSSIPTAKVLNTLKENNVKLTNYATYDLATKNYESDKDSSGNTISSSLITKKAKYIYGMNISNSEKNGLLKVIAGNDYSPTVEDMSKLNGDYLTYFQQSGKSNNGTISAREKYMSFVNAEIPITQLNKYYNEIGKIQGTKNANGKTISGSKKQAVFDYVNSLSLNVAQKKLLLSTQYSSFKTSYYQDVFDYINSLKMTKEEKQKILNDIYS